MAGIPLQEAHIGLDGLLADRQYAFVHSSQAATNNFPWMTARQSSRMLLYQPQLAVMPTPDEEEPLVQVRTPEGNVREIGDPALCEEIASLNGNPLFLLKSNRGNFDAQHLSLFSLPTVDALAAEAGSPIDPRQFRANIYMQPASGRAFDEETWSGHLLQIGESVLIGVTKRDSRCMITNLNPQTGEQNPAVLRTIVQRHDRKAGVYANVVRRGLVRVGDSIRLVAKN
jgi:uncharacterized protein YcbX